MTLPVSNGEPQDVLASEERLLVIGDIHGDRAALEPFFAQATAEERHIVLIGDLVDRGPDSAGVLDLLLPRVLAGEISWIRGNHDDKLYRALRSGKVQVGMDLARTLEQMRQHAAADLPALFLQAYPRTRLWLTWRNYVFVHGAFDPEMLTQPGGGSVEPRGRLRALSLYGMTSGAVDESGYPVRLYDWIDRIPDHLTVIVGHDVRSTDQILRVTGSAGGEAVFLDTGAGKGGVLSAIRLPEESREALRSR